MFDFTINNRPVELSWYFQEIVTSSAEQCYGYELLTRAHYSDTQEAFLTFKLFEYLNGQPELMLEILNKQINDVAKHSKLMKFSAGKFWINLPANITLDATLFDQFLQSTLMQVSPDLNKYIIFEISEECAINEVSVRHINQLQQAGFALALDDFGAGYSNLKMLNESSFNFIKIDLGLLNKVPTDIWQSSFYREIIELCSSTGSLIVAEGVETRAQADFVQWAGADFIQGFFFSHPTLLA